MRSRQEAIREILDRHGHETVYIASTGFSSRAVFAEAGTDYDVFYMQGSMGLAPAIGLGMALARDVDVVVINGDGALVMSLGTTHTIRDHDVPNLFHYVLDNGCHESVGGQPVTPLEPGYPGVSDIIKVERGGKPPRVAIEPEPNTSAIMAALRSRPHRNGVA